MAHRAVGDGYSAPVYDMMGLKLPNILASIQRSLTAEVTAAGFQPSDRASWRDLAWVEYRRQDADGIVLLGVVWIPAKGKITAEVWRPDRLAEALQPDAPEQAIEWQHDWHCGPGDDARVRAQEVAAGIIARLSEPPPRR
jgi:hypothetical protein